MPNGIIGKFFGRTVGEGAGVAIGTAASTAVEPPLQPLANTMRKGFAFVPLGPGEAAELAARQSLPEYDGIDLGDVKPQTEAGYNGVRPERFAALTELAREHPGVSDALRLRLRNLAFGGEHGIDQATFREYLRRQGFTRDGIDNVAKLLTEYLTPADIANAVQQGFVPGDGLLAKASPPDPTWTEADGPYTVPVEQVPIDPTNEAQVSGLDSDRLKVLAELVGLPPGEAELLDMWRRGIIGPDGYAAGLREGHTKTKWTAALSARFYQLVPQAALVNLRLRGWIGDDAYHKRMLRHGFRAADADDLFHAIGRPATAHQALVGFRRGGTYDGPITEVEDYFHKAVQQSDIRPEWTNLLWHGRETFPSAFVVRMLVQAGALTGADAADLFYKNGWPRDLADKAGAAFARSGTAKGDPHVTKAQNQLWTRTHSAFVLGDATEAEAKAKLAALGVAAGAVPTVIALWNQERSLTRKELTAAQLKKAYAKLVPNPATGEKWTRDEVIGELVTRGMTLNDAITFVDTPSGK